MKRTMRNIALAISASALTQNPLQAERLAYEGFDYTEANGTSVAGLNGGTGWDEAFPTPDGPHVLANGLTFTGLSTVGKSMNRSNGTLTANGRNWAASVDTSATYWYSYLLNSTIGTDGNGPEGTFNLFQTTSDNQNGAGIEFRKGTSGAIVIKVTGYRCEDSSGWTNSLGAWENHQRQSPSVGLCPRRSLTNRRTNNWWNKYHRNSISE
jgi:hypothetical protein